ncbi:MAG: hypothetical protein ACREEB_09780 [Caulobacteraceae bacterium]
MLIAEKRDLTFAAVEIRQGRGRLFMALQALAQGRPLRRTHGRQANLRRVLRGADQRYLPIQPNAGLEPD